MLEEGSQGDTYQDAAEPILEERRMRRKTAIAGATALAIVFAWIWLIDAWTSKARAFLGPTAEAYYWEYTTVPFLVTVVVGLVSCAFRGRSWFRLFVSFSIAGALCLLTQLKTYAQFPAKIRDAQEQARIDARNHSLFDEQQRLVKELTQQPPLGADGLASAEAIASNENRLAELLDVVSVMSQLDVERHGLRSAQAMAPKLEALLRQQRDAQAADYRSARAALAFLRTSWGRWSLREQQVRFAAPDEQNRFDQLLIDLKAADQKTDQLAKKIKANVPL